MQEQLLDGGAVRPCWGPSASRLSHASGNGYLLLHGESPQRHAWRHRIASKVRKGHSGAAAGDVEVQLAWSPDSSCLAVAGPQVLDDPLPFASSRRIEGVACLALC